MEYIPECLKPAQQSRLSRAEDNEATFQAIYVMLSMLFGLALFVVFLFV